MAEDKDKKQKALEALQRLRAHEDTEGTYTAPVQKGTGTGAVKPVKKMRPPGRPKTKKEGVKYARVHGQIPEALLLEIRKKLLGDWSHLQSLDNVVEAAITEYYERHK